MHKKIIGRIDIAQFPALDLDAIAVKIDSGAYTSSIHCHEIGLLENGSILQFRLLDPQHEQYHDKQFFFTEFEEKAVRNSFGESENRFVVKTKIVLFNEIKTIELSLTDRGNMKFPVLLGRKILSDYLVDVSLENLSFNNSLQLQK